VKDGGLFHYVGDIYNLKHDFFFLYFYPVGISAANISITSSLDLLYMAYSVEFVPMQLSVASPGKLLSTFR
jgi:hypothetical protein